MITIIGLGPGDPGQITIEALEKLKTAAPLFLRTARHPAVNHLTVGMQIKAFDYLYDSVASFDELYEKISEAVINHALVTGDAVYAVPGHPLVGESTVSKIISRAKTERIKFEIIPGISFIEPVLTALHLDALDGLQIFDAIQIGEYLQPPVNTDVPIVLGQVYSRFVAGEVKSALLAQFPEDHEVALIHAAGTVDQKSEWLPLHEIDKSESISHLTSLYVPPVGDSGSLQSFAEIVAYLRGPDGCPWDQEQTRDTLQDDFFEEVIEALEALNSGDPEHIKEELGDVLYHIVMQAQIGSELDEFNLRDIISGIHSKLVRRHPHIWGDVEVHSTAEVIRNWEDLKQQEKGESVGKEVNLDTLPNSLPALAQAQLMQTRVGQVGFDWLSIDGVEAKLEEELAELGEAKGSDQISYELGDVLFAIVNLARWKGVNAESSLRLAVNRFRQRFELMEVMAAEQGNKLADLDLRSLDQLWEKAKISLRSAEETPISTRSENLD